KLPGDLVPEHHRIFLRIGLGDGGEPAAASARLLEAEAKDALDARTREDGGLHRHLVRRALMDAAAGAGVLTFRVLADAENIETFRTQRAFDARQQAVRAYIGILHEGLAD